MSGIMRTTILAVMALALAWVALGCRGAISTEPPFHPNTNMDQQSRFDPQEPNAFFEDNRSARMHVEGTVARGSLHADDHLHRGRVDGAFSSALPQDFTLDTAFLERGQDRYAIYCTPCHGGTGIGDGIVVQRGMMKPPSFHEERILSLPVGALYDIVTHGIRNMPPYRQQLSLRDRWAVASYVRALQISRSARLEQIPADKAASQRWEIR
jgi:mono/diheme cytochrome c family protein